MADWRDDKRWSDRFLPEIKSVLGLHLIGEPPVEEDAERNTDLMVLRMEAVRVGCRIRKHSYIRKYGEQFTIRAGRPRGTKTELTKIIEGWGDYFFYGFADEQERRLERWTLADLRVFRREYMRKLVKLPKGEVPGLGRNNHDGSSNFCAFEWGEFPPEIIIAASSGNGRAWQELLYCGMRP